MHFKFASAFSCHCKITILNSFKLFVKNLAWGIDSSLDTWVLAEIHCNLHTSNEGVYSLSQSLMLSLLC